MGRNDHCVSTGWVYLAGHRALTLLLLLSQVVQSIPADAELDQLILSSGGTVHALSPSFGPSVISYNCSVSSEVDTINVTSTTNRNDAIMVIGIQSVNHRIYEGGYRVPSNSSHQLDLATGENHIMITVTASNAVDLQIYKVRIMREESTNTQLQQLTLTGSGRDLKGNFITHERYMQEIAYSHTQDSYIVPVENTVSIIRLTATLVEPLATRGKVHGLSIRSGEQSDRVRVAVGSNPVKLVLTAPSGTQRTITVHVVRAAGVVQCVKWRQTKRCDPHGEREPESDSNCADHILEHWSGYCECENLQQTAHMSCGHDVFTCTDKCAKLQHNTATLFGVSGTDEMPGADATPVSGVSTVFRYGAGGAVRDEECALRVVDPAPNRRTFYSEKEEPWESGDFGYAITAASVNGGPGGIAHKNSIHRQTCMMGPLEFGGAWCAYTNTGSEWYTMDTGALHWVAGVVVLGRSDANHWVTALNLSTSNDGVNFSPVQNGQVFAASSDRNTHSRVLIDRAIAARWVRIHPIEWNDHIALRAGVVLCEAEESTKPLCGIGVDGNYCEVITTPSGSKYVFAEGYTTDDPERLNQGVDYPDQHVYQEKRGMQFGPRAHKDGANVYVGHRVTPAECAAACSQVGCGAFNYNSDSCMLFSHVDRSTQARRYISGLTTYYLA